MSIYTAGVIISIIVYIVIGNYAGKSVKDVDDYYVSGRNAPTVLIAGTLFASMLSTNGFMGDTGFAFDGHPMAMIVINSLTAGGYVFGPLIFGRYLRRAEVITMPQYFGDRFNSRRLQKLAGITTIISLAAYLLAVMQGTSMLLEELTGLPYSLSLLIAWICFTSFTFYSGSAGVILTDTLMFFIFIIATLVAGPYIFSEAGGFSSLITNLMASEDTPDGLLSYHGSLDGGTILDAMSYMVTIGFVWLVTVSVSPWQSSRNLMARDEHTTFRAGAVAAICSTLFLAFLYAVAISINLIPHDFDNSERAMIWAAFNVVPSLVGVFVLTGIMAAGLSSASTFLSVIGFSATNDVHDFDFQSDKQQLWTSRWFMLLISFVALALAYFIPPNIRIISWFASTVIAASWGPVAFASIWSKRITARGAFWGMLLGFIGQIGAQMLMAMADTELNGLLHPFFIGIYLNLIGIYLGSKNDKRSQPEVAYQEKMHTIPASELQSVAYKRDRLYGYLLILAGVVLSATLIYFWVIPYSFSG